MEYRTIAGLVRKESSVLDLGCGTGDLLSLLAVEKNVRGQGIEIDERSIYACVARGLSVFHGDIDSGLSEYADKSFDYVVLCESLQEVRHPDIVLKEALRVGRKVIVSFPNFAHYRARVQLFFRGRTPVTPALPFPWYDTPNLHFLSIGDFIAYCSLRNIRIARSTFLCERGTIRLFPSLRALVGIFVLSRPETPPHPSRT